MTDMKESDNSSFIGYNDPNTRGLLQDLAHAMTQVECYTLTEDEVEAVYLGLARMHDLENYGYNRDWESIETYCPRNDE